MSRRKGHAGASLAAAAAVVVLLVAPTDAVVPCKPDGSSLDCRCASLGLVQVVNCGFMTIQAIPTSTNTWEAATQQIVKEFYLYRTRISRILNGDLTHMTGLQTLSFRESLVSAIDADALAAQMSLVELNLEGNALTAMGTQVFRTLTALQYLRLGSNRLTAINPGTFAPLAELRELHLENNAVPAVPRLALTRLAKLFLHRNQISVVPSGVFDGLPAIQQVHLQVNPDIRRIEPGALNTTVAASATPFVGLRMEGSRSACVVGAGNTVTCECAEGFAPPAGRTDACIAVDCVARIGGIDANAEYACTETVYGSTCAVRCRAGYASATGSTAPTPFVCGASGRWEGALECSPVSCPASIPFDGSGRFSADCSADTRFGGAPCNATCEVGHVPAGSGSGSFPCGADGRWVIDTNFFCAPASCPVGAGAIAAIDPRANRTVCTTGQYQIATPVPLCTATCNPGYVGTPRTYFCGPDGRWLPGDAQRNPGVAISCAGTPCNRTGPALRDPNAFSRCRGDNSFGGDDCIVSCRSGYEPVGRVPGGGGACRGDECATCGANGQWSPSTLTCRPVVCSRFMGNEMAALNASGLVAPVDCGPSPPFGARCNVSCSRGYAPTSVPFVCDTTADNEGVWFGDIVCAPVDCGDIAAAPFDPRAVVVENRNCSGTNLSWDPVAARCSGDNTWHPTAPAHRALRCQSLGGYFSEDRVVECSPDGWALAASASASHAGLTAGAFCRRDCGAVVSVNGENFEPCAGDTGAGATCTARCATFPDVVSSFTCSASGQWVETTSTASECVALPTTGLPTLAAAASGGGTSVGADVAVIVIPVVVVIILILVLLYYFGYLRCLGLAWDMKRPGSKGTVKKASAGGSALTLNLAFSKPAEASGEGAVEPIYGSAAANFGQKAPRVSANNPKSVAI